MLLCCAAEAEANTAVLYSMLDSLDSDEDEDEARGKKPGRGALGIKRGKGKFYGHPDTSPVAKDIIRMEELEGGGPKLCSAAQALAVHVPSAVSRL